MLTIGIDPGQSGALAALSCTGELVLWADLPYIRDRKLAWVDGVALQNLFHDTIGIRPARVVVERVSSMPRQGVASSFSFGVGFGSLLGVLRAMAYPVELVTPAVWKRAMGLSSDKRASLDKARLLYPHADLRLAKHEGRAEALLIARWAVNQRHSESPSGQRCSRSAQ